MTDPMLPVPYQVSRIRRETRDTRSLEIVPTGNHRNPDSAPGQFNMLYAFGVGEVPISVSATSDGVVTHTVRDVGAATHALCSLKAGDMLGVRGPFGSSWPVEEAHGEDILFIAGGIGLAPLRPAIHKVLKDRARFGRVSLLYGVRTPADILYPRELERWRRRMDVWVTVDQSDEKWDGDVGVVTRLIPRARFDEFNTVAFICGPEVMIRFSVMELEQNGIDPNSIYISMERNMECGIGLCGHCQFGPEFICKDGPVFPYTRVANIFGTREV